MKTKEVIKQLQEADPSGDLECCIGNEDIHYIDVVASYYDGRLQTLIRDEKLEGYNIVGGKIHWKGWKVRINPMSIYDAYFDSIWEQTPFKIELEDDSPDWVKKEVEQRMQQQRDLAVQIKERLTS